MKWFPRSLFGQLSVLLFLSLVAALVAIQCLNGKSLGEIHPLVRPQLFQRYATAWRVMADCDKTCHADSLLSALASTDAHFAVRPASTSYPMNEYELSLAQGLAKVLNQPEKRLVVMFTHQGHATTGLAGRQSREAFWLTIEAPLPDGRWLVGRIRPIVHTSWWYPTGQIMLICFGSIVLVLLLFTRHIQRPLNAISRAAEHLGRGEEVGPLPEQGPAELRKVTRAFNHMQERLIRLVNNRTRIVAAISHDLRSPITSLRIRAEFIEEPKLQEAVKHTLVDMQSMVDEALHFFRNDELYEANSPVDLAKMIHRLGDEHKTLGHDVSWETPASLYYRCKELALYRSVNNLIENAVHYGYRARITVEQRDHIYIVVDDDGPGIPADRLDSAFAPFTQLADGKKSGVGLGLTIVQSCVTALGGKVELSNRPGGGLRAMIMLPV